MLNRALRVLAPTRGSIGPIGVHGFARRHANTLEWSVVVAGALLLTTAYLLVYLRDPAMPGSNPLYPLGWKGWFDQGNYYKSAFSFAHGALDVDRHWYPLGYSLLGALFARWMPVQCFLVPDLLCLLACFFAFLTFCVASSVGRTIAVLLFIAGTFGSASLRHVWSEPWNTTLSAALIWWLLALSARAMRGHVEKTRALVRMAGMGALCAAIVETRPTDAALVVVWFAVMFGMQLRSRRALLAPIAAGLAGAALLALPYAVLYLSIYGPHPTPYMRLSAGIGFRATAIWWKAYLLLIDPQPWLPRGAGLLQRLPWAAAGLAGIVAVPFLRAERRAPLGLLSSLIVATWVLFLLYSDLQPSGLWLFKNIHYFKWTFPGLLLLGFVVFRNLVGQHRSITWLSCALVLLVSSVRLVPKPATESQSAWVIQVGQPPPGLLSVYFGSLIVREESRILVNTRDFRAVPDRQGFRLIAYYHGFTGPLSLVSHVEGVDSRDELATGRWRISPRLSFPCWLPPYVCDQRRSRSRGSAPNPAKG